MPSKLRNTQSATSGNPVMRGGTAFLLIYRAVQDAPGLIHGNLHDGDGYCAIGQYWERHANTSLPSDLIDEVAAVNDSVPNRSMAQRKRVVLKWLRWRLEQLKMAI